MRESVYLTDAGRARFVDRELDNLRVDFGTGDVASVVCAFLWADSEPGCALHIEPRQKAKLVAWLRETADRLETEES